MKWIRWVVLCVVLLIVAAGLLFWFMPARVALPLLSKRMHGMSFEGLSGSVWQGHADRVVLSDGAVLGTADWQLGREVVLGRTHLLLHVAGARGRFDGRYDQVTADSRAWHDVTFHLDAAALAGQPLAGDLHPRGTLDGQVSEAVFQGNWPMTLNGEVSWADAAIQTPEGHIVLGGLKLQATSASGFLRGTLADDGSGSLATKGDIAASPLGWRADVLLRPRIADTALRHLIARFGPVGPDGSVHIQRKAGLVPAESP
ncbi:general secretion pathway protein N [Luteibacter rhizovicinus]|uniref:Type II secretion system protein N n=1 Tax=Luteibacter rhizovicinus TaxID=242606 RepID=A0A4R3YNV4_9GAMM|nr:type II secretion system protein N [Luteibacter rhizovicinus]TCV94011.1 general secretion pathway protein N [Luteibacter rhizovicinus]